MKNLVPTFETCKKLKEAGIEFEETYFFFCKGYGDSLYTKHDDLGILGNVVEKNPAPTIQELLDRLPIKINPFDEFNAYYLMIDIAQPRDSQKNGKYWGCYCHENYDKIIFDYGHDNLSEALAQLLLKLKSENLL